MAFLPIFVSIVLFIIIVIISILELRRNVIANPLDVYPNSDIIFNFTKTNFTEGGMNLIQKELKENKNGTHTLTCYKLDHRQGENAPRPKLYKFTILSNNIVTIWTKGERTIKVIISKNPIDYPEEIRNTPLGKAMVNLAMLHSLEETFSESYKEKDRAVREMVIKNSMGEMTAHTFGKVNEELENVYKLLNIMKRDSEEKKE